MNIGTDVGNRFLNIGTDVGSRRLLKPVSEYKKFSSYAELKDLIKIPEVQRNIIPKQIDNMKIYIKGCIDKGIEPIFGTIDLVKISSYPLWYVVDGQHRLSVIQDFYKLNIYIPIHVMIHNVETHDDMIEIFRIRNLGIPVPEYLIDSKNIIENKQQLIKDIATQLENVKTFRYRNSQRPYVNITVFMDMLIKSKLYTIINNVEDFMKILNYINNEAYTFIMSLDDKGKKKLGITQNMMNVWSSNGVYIGYDSHYPFLSEDYDITKYKNL